jgi:hypothetical protein
MVTFGELPHSRGSREQSKRDARTPSARLQTDLGKNAVLSPMRALAATGRCSPAQIGTPL